MANKAKKAAADETALDAVEKALSIDFNESETLEGGDLSKLEESLAKAADQLREDVDTDAAVSSDNPAEYIADQTVDLPEPPQAAANDEHSEELQSILYAMQQKPKSRIYLWTFMLSLIWIGLCLSYGYTYIWPGLEKPVSLTSLFGNSSVQILAAATLVPLLPLWAFGSMLYRALEMRQAAGNMTNAALRLLQPEKISGDAVANVGSAIRKEMTAIGDGVERAIARAGELEYMVQKEVMELERAYGDSEIRLQRLVEDIGNERREVINHAEHLRTTISDSQSNLTSEIELASSRIEETIRNAGGNLTDTLDTQSLSITSRLKDTSDGLLEVLARTGDEISNSLGSGREKLNQDISNQRDELSSMISTSGEALASMIESRTASFSEVSDQIVDKLDVGKRAFEVAFSERSDELNKIIAATGQSVTSQLKSSSSELAEHGNRMILDFEEKQAAFSQSLATQSQEFGALADKSAEQMAASLERSSAQFEENAARVSQTVEDNLSIRASDFDNRIAETAGKIEDSISGRVENLQGNLERVGADLSTSISGTAEELAAAVEASKDSLVSNLGASSENLVAALGMRTEALGKVLGDRTQAIGDTIADRLSGFGQTLTGHVDSAVANLKSQTDSLESNAKLVEDVIKAKTKSVEDVIKQGTIEFAQGLEASLEATTQKSEEIHSELQRATKTVEKTVNSNLGKLGSTLEKTSLEINQTIEAGSEKIANSQHQIEEAISRNIASGSEKFAERIATERDAITNAIDTGAEAFDKAVADRTNSLGSKINQGVHRVISTFDQKTTEAADQMESSVADLEKRLAANAGSVEKQFAAGNMILDQNMVSGRDELLKVISESVDIASNAIDGKAEKLSTLLNERAALINDTLGASLVDTQRQLENSTADLTTLLSSRSDEFANIIDKEAKPLVDRIEAMGISVGDRLSSMTKLMEEQATSLFNELARSNASLNDLINSASENLVSLQSKLSDQSESFGKTVVFARENIEEASQSAHRVEAALSETSTGLVQNMAGIATRLEAQGSLLQEATQLIDNAQTGFENTLGSKDRLLQELSSGLVERTDVINTSINAFAQDVQTTMDRLRDQTTGTGSNLAAELSVAIDDATSRFSDSVDAMRSAAATIRQELETTREEMRRGVLELPEETAQSATAMRRVVTDQIAALKDLSSIVERSGRMLDTSSAQPQAALSAAAPLAPVAPAPRSPQFPPDTTRVGSAPQFTAQTAPAPSRPAPAPRPAAAAPQDSSGWVSDLLRRASSDDRPQTVASAPLPDPRSPDQFVESLNSLSMDIASAIDHEASVELWDRYQRGETNVFTRRLYTLQGQQTFDEIRNKYSRERDFREAVDRYIDDFERLLADVSRNDQGGQMAQRYLTSDTGKVYTMLAHAAGRFG